MSLAFEDGRADRLEPSHSRRRLLAAGLGAVAAMLAEAIGRPRRTDATHLGYVELGHGQSSTAATTVTNTEANESAIVGVSSAAIGYGSGVVGRSAGPGSSDLTSPAVGVLGEATSNDLRANTIGVLGRTQSRAGTYGATAGVVGEAYGGGIGVRGIGRAAGGFFSSTGLGRGLWARSDGGTAIEASHSDPTKPGWALRTWGRLRFDLVSGVASLPAGATELVVKPGVNVVVPSFVLLTPRANIGSRGLWFTTDVTADSFTIHLSAARSTPTPVAWLLIG